MNKFFGVAIGAALFGLTILPLETADAASCKPQDVADLQRLLSQQGTFEGNWKARNGWQGPVAFKVTGGRYQIQESNANRQKQPWKSVRPKFLSESSFTFTIGRGSEKKSYVLRLTGGCHLKGVQHHPSGNISVNMR